MCILAFVIVWPVIRIEERVKGFEPSTSCLGSKHSTAELHPQLAPSVTKSSQKFTTELLDKFITSRAPGTSRSLFQYKMSLKG